MKKWGKRILLGGAALLAVVVGLVACLLSASPKNMSVPKPNGVDEVIRLASGLPKWPEGTNRTSATQSEIRAWILRTPSFRSDVTNLLKMEFLVRNSHSNIASGGAIRFITSLRDLEWRLLAEAKDESMPIADRINACLQAYELGSRSTRGGAILDGMVSTGFRIESLKTLSISTTNATSDQLKFAAARLNQLIKQAPSLEDYRDGEAFFQSTVPAKARIESWIEDIKGDGLAKLFSSMIGPLEPKMEEANRIERSTLRDLVVRSYTLAKGSAPTNWSDLIPDYLTAPLADPVTKTNLSLTLGTSYKRSSE